MGTILILLLKEATYIMPFHSSKEDGLEGAPPFPRKTPSS